MADTGKVEHQDILIAFGGEIKAMDDRRLAGWAVKFTSADDPDLAGDFFADDTEYGPADKLPLYYDHGMNPAFGKKSIGTATLRKMDEGLWFEAELGKADEFEDYIIELARQGKLRASSGAVGHLVDRLDMGKSFKITSWPMGELSLTTQPAAGMATTVMPIKQFLEAFGETPETDPAEVDEAKSTPPVDVESDADEAQEDGPLANTPQPEPQEGKMEDNKTNEQPDALKGITEMLAKLNERLDAQEAKAQEVQTVKAPVEHETKSAPGIIRKRGDSLIDGFAHWMKTGDKKAVAGLVTENDRGQEVVEIKASNATDMNTTTAADGGNTVTDDMHGEIIRRADEQSLATRAGVRRFRSSANVLDIPIDNEADSEFVATTEANTFDEDAPAIGQKVLTKVAYTKYTDVSYQLMEASSADVMDFVMDRVAMGKAKTDNNLLISEVESNGTQFKIFAGTAAIAVDELEEVALNNTNAYYVQNPADAKWIMAPATHQAIQLLDDTSIRRYYDNQAGGPREILGSEVLYSNKCEAIGSGLKPVLFGNFNYVAQLEDPGLQFLRDPYTVAVNGQVRLLWYYRTVFGVLQSGAVGYGRNITT